MINVDEWAEIRRLRFAEGMGIKAIARRLGVARNTVRSAVRFHEPPRYQRGRRPSVVDAVEPRIRELLAEFPEMPATTTSLRLSAWWTRYAFAGTSSGRSPTRQSTRCPVTTQNARNASAASAPDRCDVCRSGPPTDPTAQSAARSGQGASVVGVS